ncbi:SRPBCC domain-containing protein [Mesorhizobium sp. DCY119]|uniref:SRPBCC domain-containing protein n=1 Tax=Mesorhizobium sp. DCY119 TaxID=2108445 RepID=UPI000E6CC1AA|nr:SRPBCC domain-containing protein [Mesorhizobium sp. DCY119]RJG46925.1 SRPBCC domain-containing protein [Mesorhizobium sp. DCY119]
MTQATSLKEKPGHELLITRVFDAPRSLVYRVWTTPEHLFRWWGPKDFTAPSIAMDFRPGGAYRATIRSPEGNDHIMAGVYQEIVEAERIVFTFAWETDGERGLETLITVTFADQGGKTKLSFHQAPFDTVENRDSHNEGWGQCLDRLAAYLSVGDHAALL